MLTVWEVESMKRFFWMLGLAALYVGLILWVVPRDAVFGSETDWLCQHVVLAETIRDACLAQHTLLPDWMDLGSGANGYQFAYYGFLRLDVLVGCLLPAVPMAWIFLGYALLTGLASVWLCAHWLRLESGRSDLAALGAVLLMTAGALFHLHRQIMFVSHLPFLFLALISLRNGRTRWLPLWLFAICTSSFYFAPSCFVALGWYWFRLEGRRFWRGWLRACLIGAGMAAMLLLPAGLVLLEHRSGASSGLGLSALLSPDWPLKGLLVSAYGMGLSLVALYALLAGLAHKAQRADSLFLLALALVPLASYLLNGTLYARPKILIPFLPLVLLQIVRVLAQALRTHCAPCWPLALMLPLLALWRNDGRWPWLLAEVLLLCAFVLVVRLKAPRMMALVLLVVAPIGLYGATSATEKWVPQSQWLATMETRFDRLALDPRYHFDSLLAPLDEANAPADGMTRSSMYSSATNQVYASFYYDTLLAPIQINNRVALLSADDPFLLHLLGTRYLETTSDHLPQGYTVLRQEGEVVLAENDAVLPQAYLTEDVVSQQWFDTLAPYAKLDLLARTTVVDSDQAPAGTEADMPLFSPRLIPSEPLPAGLSIQHTAEGWTITAEQDCTLTLQLENAPEDALLLWQFTVTNHSRQPVRITAQDTTNMLSGASAPYPNENHVFHYKFPSTSILTLRLSAGHYTLNDSQWRSWDPARFAEKSVVPLDFSRNLRTGTLIEDDVHLAHDTLFATTIPLQRGLRLIVDGKDTPLATVNTAFAGAHLEAGDHHLRLVFTPPGKKLGCLLSLLSAMYYAALILRRRSHRF